jgi:hypothetical protein
MFVLLMRVYFLDIVPQYCSFKIILFVPVILLVTNRHSPLKTLSKEQWKGDRCRQLKGDPYPLGCCDCSYIEYDTAIKTKALQGSLEPYYLLHAQALSIGGLQSVEYISVISVKNISYVMNFLKNFTKHIFSLKMRDVTF